MEKKTNVIFLEQSGHWTVFTSIFLTDTRVISDDTSGYYYAKSWKGLFGSIAPTTVVTVAYQSLNRQQNKNFYRAFYRQSGSGSALDNNEEVLNLYVFWRFLVGVYI